MKVAIHQPQYLPWLGYLAKWAAADLLVFLDTVQYEKNGWQNRNRIKTADGPRWLTVPVHAHLGTPIAAVTLATGQPWARRHLRALELAYGRAPRFAAYHDALSRFYATSWERLAPLAIASAQLLADATGISTPTRLASTLPTEGDDASERLVALCRAVGAETYLAGGHSSRYLDAKRFADAGIHVLYQTYSHPVYAQEHGEFVPQLSALDLLLSQGDDSLPILRSGDAWSAEP